MSLPKRQKGRRSKTSAILSACFHVALVGTVAFLAARRAYPPPPEPPGGIILTNYLPETPPEKPIPPQITDVVEKTEPQPRVDPLLVPPPAPLPAPPFPGVNSPPPDTVPEIYIPATTQGVAESDPTRHYIQMIQDAYLQVWDKPPGPDDANFAAVIEAGVDSKGRILRPLFVSGSGDSKWDSAVKTAVGRVKEVGVPPPNGFPSRFIVRFDTISDIGLVQ